MRPTPNARAIQPWFVVRLGHRALALRTLKRLGVRHAYPVIRLRRPRRPDLVEAVLGSYALVSFDPALPVTLRYPSDDGWTHRGVPWPTLAELPGIVRIFHDGREPLPVREELTAAWLAGSDEAARPPPGFEAGRLVRIVDGPFASFMAKVHGLTSDHRVSVEVEIFGRSSVQDFDPEALELTA